MYIYKIVENFMIYNGIFQNIIDSKAGYNNFLQLSGLRMLISNVHLFPIINIIPGNGMGIMEYFMTSMNQVVFINAHLNDFANNFDIISVKPSLKWIENYINENIVLKIDQINSDIFKKTYRPDISKEK